MSVDQVDKIFKAMRERGLEIAKQHTREQAQKKANETGLPVRLRYDIDLPEEIIYPE